MIFYFLQNFWEVLEVSAILQFIEKEQVFFAKGIFSFISINFQKSFAENDPRKKMLKEKKTLFHRLENGIKKFYYHILMIIT